MKRIHFALFFKFYVCKNQMIQIRRRDANLILMITVGNIYLSHNWLQRKDRYHDCSSPNFVFKHKIAVCS